MERWINETGDGADFYAAISIRLGRDGQGAEMRYRREPRTGKKDLSFLLRKWNQKP
jgi:hypothetical protein